MIDLIGKKFNKLTIIKKTEKHDTQNLIIYECHCECGNVIEIAASLVKRGKTKSCGCLKKESALITAKLITTHGQSKRYIYDCWRGFIKRCYLKTDKGYKNYGGRGIAVCDEWRNSFEAFYADMGERPTNKHSLDRIDVNGDYSKKNCRWATYSMQGNNKRTNVFIEYNGENITLGQLSDKLNIPRPTVYWRYKKGYRGDKLVEKAN